MQNEIVEEVKPVSSVHPTYGPMTTYGYTRKVVSGKVVEVDRYVEGTELHRYRLKDADGEITDDSLGLGYDMTGAELLIGEFRVNDIPDMDISQIFKQQDSLKWEPRKNKP